MGLVVVSAAGFAVARTGLVTRRGHAVMLDERNASGGESVVVIRGPWGSWLITYDVVLDHQGGVVIGARGRSQFDLYPGSTREAANYYPRTMPAVDLPLEQHVRLFPEASPAAAMALPRTPEDLARVGHWAVITRDPDLYERLPEVAPAFARP